MFSSLFKKAYIVALGLIGFMAALNLGASELNNMQSPPMFVFENEPQLTALFSPAPDTYLITVEHGTADKAFAAAGDTVHLTAQVVSGMQFYAWCKDDDHKTPYTKDSEFDFVMQDTNVYFIAYYTLNTRYMLTTYYPNKFDSIQMPYGREVTRSAPEIPGYTFLHWADVNGTILTTAITYTFVMPEYDVGLYAVYSEQEFQFNVSADTESFKLTWKPDAKKAINIYRQCANAAPEKIASSKKGEYNDDDPMLRFETSYTYFLQIDDKKSNTMTMRLDPVYTDLPQMGTATVFAINTDSVAVNDRNIAKFEKPVFTAYYDDVINAKNGKVSTKKIPLITEKAQNVSSARMFVKSEIALFNTKTYNDALKKGILTKDFIADHSVKGQVDSIALYVTVKKCDNAHKQELRTIARLHFAAPVIEHILTAGHGMFDDAGLQLKLAENDYDIKLEGQRFGMKTPKVWVEYVDKGKVKKQVLKVSPLRQYVVNKRSLLTKSSITDENGASDCMVAIPAKKWSADKAKGKLPPFASFVLSTGKSMTAVPFTITE